MTKQELIIMASAGKNVLTPEEVCLLYGLTVDELANAVTQGYIRARMGLNNKIYLRRNEVETFFTLGREIDLAELPGIADQIRTSTDQKN